MKNKKGFTLIELLAVIVILVIIALIAVPIVLNMISQARRSAARSAALGYIDAIEYNNGFANAEMDGYTLITGTKNVSEINVKMKGKKPDSGSVTIDSNGKVTGATELCFNGYSANYNGQDVTVTKGCSSSSNNTPSTTTYYYQDSSDKKNQPDSSWNYYIKEESEDVTASSDVYEFIINNTHSSDYGLLYSTLEECQTAATSSGATSNDCTVKYESGTNYSKIIHVQACVNVSTFDGELCLNPNEYETSVNKIKTYFEYDENTWNNAYNPSSTIACEYTNGNLSGFTCVGLNESFNITAETSGIVYVGNNSISKVCSISNLGAVGCF